MILTLALVLSVIPVAVAFFVWRAMEPRPLPPPPDEIHSAVKVRVYDRFGRFQYERAASKVDLYR